ncbi:MAG: tRNA (adenosine(37)-N6)-threonylcarbamoyltransferase complex ATPase subunit type 1 TsaE [Pseudomonadota bacterium]|nr:tRNA (adenosine(37)-N6)-threonylcarbamoyltransferase complex ATPase subunit type 1 TsaE [Pseudomonadota bacterium]
MSITQSWGKKTFSDSPLATASAEETLAFGERLGASFKNELYVITLQGELGAGKTLLTKGIAKGLGVSDWYYLNSPTFTLINEYQGRLPLYHFDLYRLGDIDELFELGFNDYLAAPGVLVIEWPEKASSLLPTENLLNIRLEIVDSEKRLLHLDEGWVGRDRGSS